MIGEPEAVGRLYPWRRKTVSVNGRRMAYIDEGPPGARPALLLHGNPVWGYLYHDFVAPLLEAGYRVIVPDWIGAGRSEKPRIDAAYSLAHHIADLVSLIDQLDLKGVAMVGQDWGGPQGLGAALQRLDRVAAITLMNTWAFTDYKGRFHTSARPWTSWHAPILGPFFQKRMKVLSYGGPWVTNTRAMPAEEARAYHAVYDEPESETVVLTWPRTIPLREGDRGWADMASIQARLPQLKHIPIQLIWAPEDQVFPIEYAERLKALLPHAEGPTLFENARHFLQDDRGPEIAPVVTAFFDRTAGSVL